MARAEDGATDLNVPGASIPLPAGGAARDPLVKETSDDYEVLFGGATESLMLVIGDETTPQTATTAKLTFNMPYAFTLTEVRASVVTAPTDADFVVDINEGGTTVLSTKLTIDATELTSTTSAAPAVISDAVLADDAVMSIDVDQIGSTIAGTGLKVTLIGYRT